MRQDTVTGHTYVISCSHCWKKFFWYAEKDWWNHIPQFCSRKCRVRKNKKRQDQIVTCPNPFKRGFRRWNEAHEEAVTQSRGQNLLYTAYRCDCGAWHVGHRKATRKNDRNSRK